MKMILRCRLTYPYDFGIRLTIFGAILRPYDCCQFPYDSANWRETWEKARQSLAFSPVSKPHTHITYMLRQCTSIVYLLTQMSFIYCHLNFHANLLRPWRFPLKRSGHIVKPSILKWSSFNSLLDFNTYRKFDWFIKWPTNTPSHCFPLTKFCCWEICYLENRSNNYSYISNRWTVWKHFVSFRRHNDKIRCTGHNYSKLLTTNDILTWPIVSFIICSIWLISQFEWYYVVMEITKYWSVMKTTPNNGF
jgi:hypothetical protein